MKPPSSEDRQQAACVELFNLWRGGPSTSWEWRSFWLNGQDGWRSRKWNAIHIDCPFLLHGVHECEFRQSLGSLQHAAGSKQQLKHHQASPSSKCIGHSVYHQECVFLQSDEECWRSDIPLRPRVRQFLDRPRSVLKPGSRIYNVDLLFCYPPLSGCCHYGAQEFFVSDQNQEQSDVVKHLQKCDPNLPTHLFE